VPPDEEDLPELAIPEEPRGETAAALEGLPDERYRPVARLGAGAFGEVYRAHDELLGRDVAVKRIRLEAFVEPGHLDEVKKRFVREARVAARLRHRHIVTVHDIVSTPGTSLIVMELVNGRTLQSVLHERGRLGLEETTRILEQVADALDHAHANGVVHRDVKPANIMVAASGDVKVMDFGIAKLEEGANLTSTGSIMGTPNYMAPEQARGEVVSARSDVFSLGCVLYECLTGTRPFQSPSVSAILVKILTEDPPPVDFEALGLPRRLAPVIARATAKNPDARYPSGAAMVEAVRGRGESVPDRADVAVTVAARPGRPPDALPDSRPPAVPTAALARRTPVLRRLHWVAGAAILVAAGAWVSHALRPPRPLPGHTLVAREDVGTLGRLLGREPRLVVTLPPGTVLRLGLVTPLSSEKVPRGAAWTAETTRAVRIEGIEVVPEGAHATGRVTHAVPAEEEEGRGELTLALESLRLPGGTSFAVRARPIALRAPAARKKDEGIRGSLSDLSAAVGGLIGRARGGSGSVVAGGSASVVVVATRGGRDVALESGAPLSLELLEPATVVTDP
jgi:tRNA A-37 threonylcarbamoyl transferase component Bud32